jgi:hypothetical protein
MHRAGQPHMDFTRTAGLLRLSRLRERPTRPGRCEASSRARRVRAFTPRGFPPHFSTIPTRRHPHPQPMLRIGVLLENGGRRPPLPPPQAGEGAERRRRDIVHTICDCPDA